MIDDRRQSRTPSGRSRCRARPATGRRRSAVPTMMPRTAPNVDTITASQRTVRRVWRLVMPTARIRPISRVRSNTPRASVIEMPSTAMTIAKPSRTVMIDQQLVDLALLVSRNSALVCTLACGNGGHRRLDGGVALLPDRPPRPAWRRRRSRAWWTPGHLLERVERDQPVAGERGVVVDPGDWQRRAWCRSGTSRRRCRRRRGRDPRPGRCGRITPPSARSCVAALAQVEVDELLERERVDGADGLLRRRRSSAWCRGPRSRPTARAARSASSATAGGRPWNDSSVTM